MSFAAGTTVANLYYNQPLLEQMRETFSVTVVEIGWVATLTQVGYAGGMLFLVPMGDMHERRRLVVLFTLLSSIFSAWVGFASNFQGLVIASFLLGVSTMTPQLLIPFAAHLAPPDQKGKVVGTLVSGLLLGILLARTISGFVGSSFGWRAMFGAASIFLFGLSCILLFSLPKSAPSYKGTYTGLLASVVKIFKTQPVLREAAFFGAMLFGAFSAFWATLIHLMEAPQFELSAKAVGLYGLLGAGAALLGPVVGGLADRRNPRSGTGAMIALTLVSFVVFFFSSHSLIGIGVGVLLMDIGVQSGHISNQSRIFPLVPGAQSRIQTAYMFFYFAGGAVGSTLGAYGFNHYGWTGVCGAAGLMLSLGLIKFIFAAPPSPRGL